MENNFLMATIDICIKLQYLHNLSHLRIGPLFYTFSVKASENEATPYQVLGSQPSNSTISIEQYNSPILISQPYQYTPINQTFIFKLHVPFEILQTSGLKIKCQMKTKRIQSISTVTNLQVQFESILHANGYVPFLFQEYLCSVEGSVSTHLLSIWNFQYRTSTILLKSIESLVQSYNRLRQKYLIEIHNDQFEYTVQSLKINEKKSQQQYPLLNITDQQQYKLIQDYQNHRIFKPFLQSEYRTLIIKTMQSIIPQICIQLMILWKAYIKKIVPRTIRLSKLDFIEQLATQVRKRVYSNQHYNKKLTINGICITQPDIKFIGSIKIPSQQKFLGECPHIFVLVHGLGATSLATTPIEIMIRHLYPHIDIINSKANQNDQNLTFQQMGSNLAKQIQIFITKKQYKDFQISFIGHSIGGLIVRAALPHLKKYRYSMKNYISLGTPHLGYHFHNSNLTKFGLWALNKFNNNSIIESLLMKGNSDIRSTFLYQINAHDGLAWFQSVNFFGSESDKYVSTISALIEEKTQIKQLSNRGDFNALIWQQMKDNINSFLRQRPVNRIYVEFSEKDQGNWKDKIFGRASHIAFLNSKNFIKGFLLGHSHLFI